ncbi:response regulator [Magnetococcales bacterium HHB-1]
MEQVNVLLVDDDARNLESLSAILASSEYNLVQALSGEEALSKLLTMPFAVMILDVMMPEINGFELARMIKARKKTADIPIIFLTAIHTDEMDMFQGYALGAFDYLIKPAHPAVLKAKVAVFANLYRQTEAIKRQHQHKLDIRSDFERNKDMDRRWQITYRDLLLQHVRAVRDQTPPPSEQVEALAMELRSARFLARDVVRLHMDAMQEISRELRANYVESFSLDARLMLLELTGRLLDIYGHSILRQEQKKRGGNKNE